MGKLIIPRKCNKIKIKTDQREHKLVAPLTWVQRLKRVFDMIMLGFKSFRSVRATLAGIEIWRMLKKVQNENSLPVSERIYVLAAAG